MTDLDPQALIAKAHTFVTEQVIGQEVVLVRHLAEALEAALTEAPAENVPAHGTCTRPPEGWWCSLSEGHDGPCPTRQSAYSPTDTKVGEAEKLTDLVARIRIGYFWNGPTEDARRALAAEFDAMIERVRTTDSVLAKIAAEDASSDDWSKIDAAIEALCVPHQGDHSHCAICGKEGEYFDSPTGAWWSHVKHPADEHDFVFGTPTPASTDAPTDDELHAIYFSEKGAQTGAERLRAVFNAGRSLPVTRDDAKAEALRTERDAALAVIDKARTEDGVTNKASDRHAHDCSAIDWDYDGLIRGFNAKDCDCYLVTLATVLTSALADRDARTLEEAADEIDAYMTLPKGMNTIEQRYFRPWHADWLRARATTYRATSQKGDGQ